MWRVVLARKAEKQLGKLPIRARARVLFLVGQIAHDPYVGKKLSGNLKGEYSVRSWPYRILYKINKRELIVLVVKIEHRQGVYK